MSKVTEIQAQIAALQAQLVILNSAPSDVYSFGTVVRFAFENNTKVHFLKTAEETWRKLESTEVVEDSLAEWILEYKTNSGLYFEVYLLTVASSPFYASA